MEKVISLIQFEPKFGDIDSNFEYIKEKFQNSNSDIVVFPELSTSGYFFQSRKESERFAWETDCEEMQDLQDLAESLNKILVFGFPEKADKKIFNSAAILFPDRNQSSIYRKTHLFYRERFCFDEGDTGFFVINYEEWDLNIGLMICYDWRFPESARSLALQGADLIICPSNLVTGVWDNVMSTRALENKVYVAVANRIGKEKKGKEELLFNGISAIYSYNGKKLCQAGDENEIEISATIEAQDTRDKSFNEFNDIFKDRRRDFYNL